MTFNTCDLLRTIRTVILRDVIKVIELNSAEFCVGAQRDHLGRFLDVLNRSISDNSPCTRDQQERKNKA
jgi:hypothetical protein